MRSILIGRILLIHGNYMVVAVSPWKNVKVDDQYNVIYCAK